MGFLCASTNRMGTVFLRAGTSKIPIALLACGSLLVAGSAQASCSGQRGEELERCLADESTMLQRYRAEMDSANAQKISLLRDGKAVTLSYGEAGGLQPRELPSYSLEGACAALKKTGKYTSDEATFSCRDGKLDGTTVVRDATGTKRGQGNWRAGKRNGAQTHWDEQGHKISEIVFRGEDLVGQEWDAAGKLIRRWEYKNGKRDGEWLEDGKSYRLKDGKNVPPVPSPK